MKNFFRSLQYLKPYRFRLGMSILCALLVAALWSGGFTLVGPAMKILLDEDGLHGWAWSKAVQDRLGVTLVQRVLPARVTVDDQPLVKVMDVVRITSDGPAAAAGIAVNDWVVGLDDGVNTHAVMRGDDLARLIATLPPGQSVKLRIASQQTPGQSARTLEVTLGDETLGTDLLVRVARGLPEPRGDIATIKQMRYELFIWLLIVSVIATLLRNALRFCQEYLVQTAVFRSVMDIRCENYGVALRLPLTYFSQKGSSDTMSRFIADTGELAQGQETLFGKTMVEPARALGCIILAFMVSWELTLMGLVVGPVVFFLVRMLAKIMKRASRKALEGWSRMLGALEETLTGLRVVKAYTAEPREERRFREINESVYKQQRRMARIDAGTSPMIEVIGITAGMAVVSLAGYWVVIEETMDPEIMAMWVALLAGMFDPMRKLSKVVTRFHRADAGATRIFELRDQDQQISPPGAPDLPRHGETLAFDQVNFRYEGADAPTLSDIQLSIEAGHSVAFVGPNGSGKTTLISMVPRLLDPDSGAIRIDGQNIAQVDLRSLREQIAVVTQDSVLFHATIAENIAYGCPDATREQIEAAARKAFVDEFVREMPDGYDTIVGEHGATLSGGQKQRITIARAVLRDPAILIFDEAMSQVDSDSERRIHEALEEVIQGRTTLIVAHRFATVLSADRIAVMESGRIVDSGTHEQLLGRCALYTQLYETQFADSGGTS